MGNCIHQHFPDGDFRVLGDILPAHSPNPSSHARIAADEPGNFIHSVKDASFDIQTVNKIRSVRSPESGTTYTRIRKETFPDFVTTKQNNAAFRDGQFPGIWHQHAHGFEFTFINNAPD
uniref:Uncharacterized protein n=1 Tax=Candidatus Methanogaster sp. ANME-2c ERB4 TaxID=2759911 RepID=A0A7G9YJU6_9EURY|nr:hypothetical protein NDNLHAIA_00009 [Methanosarcinales archaeon ANME-2c ERB4]